MNEKQVQVNRKSQQNSSFFKRTESIEMKKAILIFSVNNNLWEAEKLDHEEEIARKWMDYAIENICKVIKENYQLFYESTIESAHLSNFIGTLPNVHQKTILEFSAELTKTLKFCSDDRESMMRNDPIDCFASYVRLIKDNNEPFKDFLKDNPILLIFLIKNIKRLEILIQQWEQNHPNEKTESNVTNDNNIESSQNRNNASYLKILKDNRMNSAFNTTLYFFKKYKKFMFNVFCSESIEYLIKIEKDSKKLSSLKQLQDDAKNFFDIYNRSSDEKIHEFDTNFSFLINGLDENPEMEARLSAKLGEALLDLILFNKTKLMEELLSSDIGVHLTNFFAQEANRASDAINKWLEASEQKFGEDYVKYTLIQRERIEYTVIKSQKSQPQNNNKTPEGFSSDEENNESTQKFTHSEHKRPPQQDFTGLLNLLSDVATHNSKKQRTVESTSSFTSQEHF